MCDLLNDPAFISNIGDRGVRTTEDACEHVEKKYLAHYARHGYGIFVVERRRDGQPVGMCGLVNRDTVDDVDIGYAIHPAFRRRGYALEAARATLDFAFDTLGLERVVAYTWPHNDASAGLLKKLGMRYERTTRLADDEEQCRVFVIQREVR